MQAVRDLMENQIRCKVQTSEIELSAIKFTRERYVYTKNINDEILNNKRDIYIKLPNGAKDF